MTRRDRARERQERRGRMWWRRPTTAAATTTAATSAAAAAALLSVELSNRAETRASDRVCPTSVANQRTNDDPRSVPTTGPMSVLKWVYERGREKRVSIQAKWERNATLHSCCCSWLWHDEFLHSTAHKPSPVGTHSAQLESVSQLPSCCLVVFVTSRLVLTLEYAKRPSTTLFLTLFDHLSLSLSHTHYVYSCSLSFHRAIEFPLSLTISHSFWSLFVWCGSTHRFVAVSFPSTPSAYTHTHTHMECSCYHAQYPNAWGATTTTAVRSSWGQT